jgi:hypothetical protein
LEVDVENIAGGDLFDSLPDQCPGCGQWDTPAQDGPSKLMILWIPALSAYLCLACKDNWAKWVGTNWAPEIVKSTGLDLRATNKPKCVKNIEALAEGNAPDYTSWQTSNNVMGMGYCPPVP